MDNPLFGKLKSTIKQTEDKNKINSEFSSLEKEFLSIPVHLTK